MAQHFDINQKLNVFFLIILHILVDHMCNAQKSLIIYYFFSILYFLNIICDNYGNY